MHQKTDLVIFSFGYKYGCPEEVNYLFDVRFLPNPYWVETLREKTGRVREVADYVLQSDGGRTFIPRLASFLKYCIDENRAAAKKSLRIAIGCTGGRHRSVAVVERLAALFAEENLQPTLYHRDIERDVEKRP
jgi:UPF0042 nucleotide-binding protein